MSNFDYSEFFMPPKPVAQVPTTTSTTPTSEAAKNDSKKAKDPVATANMWGNIANAAASMFQTGAGLVGVLDPKAREAQVAIAQANAQAANATAPKQVFGIDSKYLWIGGGALALIIVLLLFKKK